MAEVIRMPKMSDTMTEGVIVAWNKKVGDSVKPGDILAEVETDKATMELENYVKGTLLHIGIKEGEAVPVDSIIAIVGKEGEDISELLKGGTEKKSEPRKEEAPQAEQKAEKKDEAPKTDSRKEEKSEEKTEEKSEKPQEKEESYSDGRIKASPLAKKLAEEKGIELTAVNGSGENGRIVKRDVESFTPSKTAAKSAGTKGEESYEEINVSQMRKTIAKRLAESKFSAPHFYLTMEIDMDKIVEARAKMNEYSDVKISVNDIIIKASAIALRKHPWVNSSWLGDKIRFNNHINIGVAIAVEEGLLVPVVRYADNKSLSEISSEVKTFSDKAKNKKLQPQDWEGNTFTISNLGMFGIEEFTAIINPPDACILAVGGVKQVPVIRKGQVVAGNVMKVTLSCDHRVVDGVTGSQFLQTLKSLLEEPVKLLV